MRECIPSKRWVSSISWVGGWLSEGDPAAEFVNQTLFARGERFRRPTIWLYGQMTIFIRSRTAIGNHLNSLSGRHRTHNRHVQAKRRLAMKPAQNTSRQNPAAKASELLRLYQ
jgi:hypothetical protein